VEGEDAGTELFGHGDRTDRIADGDFSNFRVDGAGVEIENRGMHSQEREFGTGIPGGKHLVNRKIAEPVVRGFEPELDGVKAGPGYKREDLINGVLVKEHACNGVRHHGSTT